MKIEPALTNIEVVEKTFSTQYRRHVVGYGGGIRAKDLRDSSSSKAELHAKLKQTEEENQNVRSRLNAVEAELKMLKDMILSQQSSAQPSTSQSTDQVISDSI